MGTHPIFESDFDCLTGKKYKMTSRCLFLGGIKQSIICQRNRSGGITIEKLKSLDKNQIHKLIRRKIEVAVRLHQKELRKKYNFEYGNWIAVSGKDLYMKAVVSADSSLWSALPESEKDVWREKAKIENVKREKANEPAILEAINNNDIIALSETEYSRYHKDAKYTFPKGNGYRAPYIYNYELNCLKLKITKQILNDLNS